MRSLVALVFVGLLYVVVLFAIVLVLILEGLFLLFLSNSGFLRTGTLLGCHVLLMIFLCTEKFQLLGGLHAPFYIKQGHNQDGVRHHEGDTGFLWKRENDRVSVSQ